MYDENYLAHYGILGQKWGVRRFETSDGHLTPAGQARYSKRTAKKIAKQDRIIGRTNSKTRMRKAVVRKRMLQSQGNIGNALKTARNVALVGGTAALAGYAMSKNSGKQFANAKEYGSAVLGTMGKTALQGAKKVATSDIAKKAGRAAKKALTSDNAKNTYKAVGKGIGTVASSVAKTGGKVANRALKKKIFEGTEGNNARPLKTVLENSRGLVDRGKTIYQASKALQQQDMQTAATLIGPEAINAVNKVVSAAKAPNKAERAKNFVNKIRGSKN